MDVPIETYESLLNTETTIIARRPGIVTEFMPVLYSRDDNAMTSPTLVHAVNTHMVRGVESPRLRKVDIPYPQAPAPEAIEADVIANYTSQLAEQEPVPSDDQATNLAETVASICKKIDKESPPTTAPFKTFGVLGMYATSGRKPLVRSYISKAFLLEMAALVPTGYVESVPEEETAEIREQVAAGALRMLLLPQEHIHPRIQAVLFQ